MRHLFIIYAVISLWTGATLTTFAQNGYPLPQERYINDFAGVLSQEDQTNIRALLKQLDEGHGIEATVVTISSMQAYDPAAPTIESFGTGLFNSWGIGDSERNDGILLLVAVEDRQVRIELGAGYGAGHNAAMQEVINEHILPSFRQGAMSQGIYRGVRAIVGQLTGEWPPDLSGTSTPETGFVAAFSGSLRHLSPITTYLGGGSVIAFIFYMIRRRRAVPPKPRCPQCQSRMREITGATATSYLSTGQQQEQALQSVRHEVWLCPRCQHHLVHSHPRLYGVLEDCPQCHYKTVKVDSRTEVAPTFVKKGRQRVHKNCQHCDYAKSYTFSLSPKKRTSPQRSRNSSFSSSTDYTTYSSSNDYSSSSSSDFSGGSSDGGGASGEW